MRVVEDFVVLLLIVTLREPVPIKKLSGLTSL